MNQRQRITATLATILLIAASTFAQDEERPPFSGLDESVNEALASEAGVPSRDPLIDTESWGELWNLLLLGAGGICGFIIGRRWDQLWGRVKHSRDDDGNGP